MGQVPTFSIVIPTWKHIEYLDLAYRSIRKNSAEHHEIIVFFNEQNDSCNRWVKGKDVLYAGSSENLGVCAAVNRAAKMATTEYICYMNDDMYVLPGWDTAFAYYLGGKQMLWLSGTAIEPGRGSDCYIGRKDYGRSPQDFREEDLLKDFSGFARTYDVVSTWTPTLLRKSDWDAIGGFDERYFPGDGSDPDLAMKMYQCGCRSFIGVGRSLVYHFSSSTVSRFKKRSFMDSSAYFRKKWGMPRKYFLKRILWRGCKINSRVIAALADGRVRGALPVMLEAFLRSIKK